MIQPKQVLFLWKFNFIYDFIYDQIKNFVTPFHRTFVLFE